MSRWSWLLGAALLCGLLPLQTSPAADAARVKLVPPQTLSVTAGERLTFSVVLMALGQFAGPTYLDLPDFDGAIIMQDSERPTLGTEQVGDETYVTASHEVTVYPQRGGRLTVAPITARFGSKKRYDQPTIEHRLQTQPFDIEVTAPPGALAGEVIVSTSTLEATESWSPQPVSAKVGDAFIRTITVRAQDVPAMLLPSPAFQKVEGFALYTKAPRIRDEADRGTFSAERIDTVTYVSERAGSFQIPELSLRWWDPGKGRWQTQRFPAVTLEVAQNPALAVQSNSDDGAIKSSADVKALVWWFVVVAGVAILLLFSRQRLKQRWQAWWTRRAASEPAQWKRLQKACGRGEAVAVYRELDRWLTHFGISTSQLTVGSADGVSDSLREACLGLQQRLAGIDAPWDARLFTEALAKLRRHLHLSVEAASASPLPPLNPARPVMSRTP